MSIDLTNPSILSLVEEVRIYFKKSAKGKATVVNNSGVIETHCTRYDDLEDSFSDTVRLRVTKDQIQFAIDSLQIMVADLKNFKTLIKDL